MGLWIKISRENQAAAEVIEAIGNETYTNANMITWNAGYYSWDVD